MTQRKLRVTLATIRRLRRLLLVHLLIINVGYGCYTLTLE